MAHDARKEDYQRLGLRFIRQLDGEDSAVAMKAFAGFGQRFWVASHTSFTPGSSS